MILQPFENKLILKNAINSNISNEIRFMIRTNFHFLNIHCLRNIKIMFTKSNFYSKNLHKKQKKFKRIQWNLNTIRI